jgi:PAS domain S-box-containing protein
MTSTNAHSQPQRPLAKTRASALAYLVAAILCWTLLLAGALWWNLRHVRATASELALMAARTSLEKDVLYRMWATEHGGVYAPVTEKTPPNPYLSHIPERDITTPSGRQLTLVNPAYMTRQVHELGRELYAYKGHITSLKPIRAANAPDAWERGALQAFEQGTTEVSAIVPLEGAPHLRLMRPLVTVKGCLRCHAQQGYKVGDIRGGVSVSVPMRDFDAAVTPHVRLEARAHAGIWLLGLGMIALGAWQLRRRRRERDEHLASMRREREFTEQLIQTANVTFVQLDLQGAVVRINAAAEQLTGYREADVVGKNWFDVLVPRARYPDVWAEFDRITAQQAMPRTFENPIVTKSGEERVIAWQNGMLRAGDDIVGTISFGVDVTERRQLEEQLRQAQKIEAVGQLAGGVAHDFNNILASMMMHLSLLQESPALDEATRAELAEMEGYTNRAASLTRQLLMFSRRSLLEIRPIDLNQVITDVLKMLGRLLGEHVAIEVTRAAALPLIDADASMLEQVLVNLAVNARDAMPSGGRLSLTTQAITIDDKQAATQPPRRPGSFVVLSVTDSGTGMDKGTLERVFEPFFTTKAPGVGTGLGLATVHGIVAQHGGWIEVDSHVGKGTTFRVYLPESTGRAAPAPERGHVVVPSGTETILVVEDEAGVRSLLVRLLRRLGYTVLEAANGREALSVWQGGSVHVDLLLTDMVMPGRMTGLELADAMRARVPGLKVIITSGYSSEFAVQGAPTTAGVTFLPKPYQSSQLGLAVRECLDQP